MKRASASMASAVDSSGSATAVDPVRPSAQKSASASGLGKRFDTVAREHLNHPSLLLRKQPKAGDDRYELRPGRLLSVRLGTGQRPLTRWHACLDAVRGRAR